MPHAAAGIGLGIIAAGAITAILAKEVIENWDEIHDRYEHFADRMEDEHELFLPRLRDRRFAYGTGSASSGSFARDHGASATSSGFARGSHQRARRTYNARPISRSERFRDVTEPVARVQTPPNAYQLPDEAEDEDFKAAIEASLLDMDQNDSHEFSDYQTPDYPKLELNTLAEQDRDPHNPFSDEAESSKQTGTRSDTIDHDDASWVGSWTATDRSVSPEGFDDHEWSDSETGSGHGRHHV